MYLKNGKNAKIQQKNSDGGNGRIPNFVAKNLEE